MRYLEFDSLKQLDRLRHGFTFKNGGVRELPYGSQHMGVLSFQHQEEAWENIKDLIQSLDLVSPVKQVVFTEQVHKDHIEVYEKTSFDSILKEGYAVCVLNETDGVFTAEKGTLLMTFYADCTPVFFYDKKQKVIGMTHSGWKGTQLKIAVKGLETLRVKFNTAVEDVQVVIGPSASQCCYEVDQKIYDAFPGKAHCFKAGKPGHYLMNMKQIIQEDLISAGLTAPQIELSPECTICQSDRYFSHRRDAGNTGRMAAFMLLEP